MSKAPTPVDVAGADRRRQRIVVGFGILFMVLLYGATVPEGTGGHYDHFRFAEVIEFEHDGLDYYDAYERAFREAGVTFDEVRAYREPAIFVVWGVIPIGWLYTLYLVGIVAGTCWIMLGLTTTPFAVFPVAAYLLMSGRIPGDGSLEQWLLVELWALPLLAAALVAWRRDAHVIAAMSAAAAVLVRETTVGLLLVALLLVWLPASGAPRRARLAWTSAAVAAALGYSAHIAAVSDRLVADARGQATILGTGDPPRTIWEMVAWMIPGTDGIGVLVVAMGFVWFVGRRRDVAPLLGLFAVAGAGLVVARPYWGFLFIPFAILFAAEGALVATQGALVALADRRSTSEIAPR